MPSSPTGYVSRLLHGQGWTYNPGEALNAATSPLHVLLLAALGKAGLAPSAAAHLLGAAGLAGAAWFTYLLLRHVGGPEEGLGAGLLLLTSPLLLSTFGLETLLYLCSAAAAVYWYQRGRLPGRRRGAGVADPHTTGWNPAGRRAPGPPHVHHAAGPLEGRGAGAPPHPSMVPLFLPCVRLPVAEYVRGESRAGRFPLVGEELRARRPPMGRDLRQEEPLVGALSSLGAVGGGQPRPASSGLSDPAGPGG